MRNHQEKYFQTTFETLWNGLALGFQTVTRYQLSNMKIIPLLFFVLFIWSYAPMLRLLVTLSWRESIQRSPPIYSRKATVMTSCLLSSVPESFWKGVCLKNFAPVDKGSQNRCGVYPFTVSLWFRLSLTLILIFWAFMSHRFSVYMSLTIGTLFISFLPFSSLFFFLCPYLFNNVKVWALDCCIVPRKKGQ